MTVNICGTFLYLFQPLQTFDVYISQQMLVSECLKKFLAS